MTNTSYSHSVCLPQLKIHESKESNWRLEQCSKLHESKQCICFDILNSFKQMLILCNLLKLFFLLKIRNSFMNFIVSHFANDIHNLFIKNKWKISSKVIVTYRVFDNKKLFSLVIVPFAFSAFSAEAGGKLFAYKIVWMLKLIFGLRYPLNRSKCFFLLI